MNFREKQRLERLALIEREEWLLSTRGKDLPKTPVGGQEDDSRRRYLQFRHCKRGHRYDRLAHKTCPECTRFRDEARKQEEARKLASRTRRELALACLPRIRELQRAHPLALPSAIAQQMGIERKTVILALRLGAKPL